MKVKNPPGNLKEPFIIEIPVGTRIHRIHHIDFGPTQFNPGFGFTRFAPIDTVDGDIVPTMYAGEMFDTAVFETLFHDMVPGGARQAVRYEDLLENRVYSVVRAQRVLKMVSLLKIDLQRYRVSSKTLLQCTARQWNKCQQWSKAFHNQYDEVDGLIWMSNKDDEHKSMLLFGDRVAKDDLALEERFVILSKNELIERIIELAGRAGYQIIF